MDLAAFDGQIDFRAAGVTTDDGVFGAQHFIEETRYVKTGRAGSRASAAGRFLGLADIVDSAIGRIGAHVVNDVVLFRRADPADFSEIEFDFRPADQLVEIDRREDGTEGKTVGLGDVIKIIRSHDGSGAGHILYQDRRIAG